MKVYVLSYSVDYEGTDILSVHLTRENASQAALKWCANRDYKWQEAIDGSYHANDCHLDITEFEANEDGNEKF